MTQTRDDDITVRPGSPDVDPEFLRFLVDRLSEEVVAENNRREDAAPSTGAGGDRGRLILVDLLSVLERGQVPDQMSLDLLTVAYAAHPDFRIQWNRWRD